MVRWSWGYNVLLAPPEKYGGTIENIDRCLESGQGESQETAPLIGGTSADSEGDEQNASGSDDTQVDNPQVGKRQTGASELGQDFCSGQETPVTRVERISSFSSGASAKSLTKAGAITDLLPTPANGNIKPSGKDSRMMSFPIMRSNTDTSVEDVPEGLGGTLARCRAAVERVMRSIYQNIANSCKAGFRELPRPLRTLLAKAGSFSGRFMLGIWAFMNSPLWAMLAAILVASIPDLQRFFFADGTFFKNSVTSAVRQSGGVAVPLILVVLGANLARNTLPADPIHTKEDDKQETKLLIAALVSRMLLPTVIMAPLLAITAKYVPVSILDDPIFVIVCFLITGAPSALQLAQICQINNVYMGAMSRLLFQSYVVWILPSTLILVLCALEVVEWAQR